MKEATVFLTQIVEGSIKKLNFCAACSQKKGLQDPMEFLLADLFQGLGIPKENAPLAGPLVVCAGCGFSHEDLKKRGRLGCSVCYQTFSETLAPMVKSAQRTMIHQGKVPKKFAEAFVRDEELEILRKSLQRAIKSEFYEEAALYRDRIAALESEKSEQHSQKIALQNEPLVLEGVAPSSTSSLSKKRKSSSKLTELPPEKGGPAS